MTPNSWEGKEKKKELFFSKKKKIGTNYATKITLKYYKNTSF